MTTRGLIGKKIGMTQIFNQEGLSMACTVVQAGPCLVVQKKTSEGKDGYGAVKLAFDPVPVRKLTKPRLGVFTKRGLSPHRFLREFRIGADVLTQYQEGQVLTCELFQPGDYVDVVGTSKGRGFAGVMKRHHFKGAKQYTHGTHEYRRHTGAAGSGSTPGHTWRGQRNAGQLGNARVTVQNLLVLQSNPRDNVLIIRGALPGPAGSLIMIHPAVKLAAKV